MDNEQALLEELQTRITAARKEHAFWHWASSICCNTPYVKKIISHNYQRATDDLAALLMVEGALRQERNIHIRFVTTGAQDNAAD